MNIFLAAATETLISQERGEITPFRIIVLLIFALAVAHTLLANHFTRLSQKVAAEHEKKMAKKKKHNNVSFTAEILSFLGEVEVIFALWAIPLFIVIVIFYDWGTAIDYIDNRSYVEPLFVVVIMTLAGTKPILTIAEGGLWLVSQSLGGRLAAWWLSILTLGPLLGALITEVGAITICALILMRQFYLYSPSKKLAYATLGLLFVNISVGGLLTNFASPPVLIVARLWEWSSWDMFMLFGWKTIVGIFLANLLYYSYFRKELVILEKVKQEKLKETKPEAHSPVPFWIIGVHVLFLIWIVFNSHYPPIFIGSFLLFLGFHQATAHHQSPLHLKRPLLVGMFLAGLIIHGGLQGWWIEPLLGDLDFGSMMMVGMILTPFNDNASITYLATLIPNLAPDLKYAIVASVVAGGGLTVIANAPNPAGQSILRRYFKNGISPLYLFYGALIPTLIFFGIYYFFS